MSNLIKKTSIAVVGGGISGLVAAYELSKKGFKVEIFEKQAVIGGRARSVVVDNLTVDIGASFLMDSYTEVYKYLEELGLLTKNQTPKSLSQSTVVLQSGKLLHYGLTGDFLSIFERCKFIFGLWKMNRDLKRNDLNFFEPWKNPTDFVDSPSKNYLLKNFDSKIVDYFFEPGLRCVQFHSTNKIGTQSLLGFFKNGVPKNGLKYFTAMPEYIGKFVESLASELVVNLNREVVNVGNAKDGRVNLTLKNGEIKSFDQVILNTTPDIIKQVYKDYTENQSEILERAEFSQSITIVFKLPKNLLAGFYLALVPFVENEIICSYTNEQIKGENYASNEYTVVNVYLHEEAVEKFNLLEKTDSEIFSFVKKEFIKVAPFLDKFKTQQKIDLIKNLLLQKWPKALSKSLPKYTNIQSEFWLNGQGQNGIWFAGDWVGGSWVEGSTRTGQKISQMITKL